MKLALHDVFRFFEAKRVSLGCPCCGADTFITGFGNNEAATALGYTSHPEGVSGFSYMLPINYARPVISVDCINCGNMRLFNYYVIYNWALQNPVQPLPNGAPTFGH